MASHCQPRPQESTFLPRERLHSAFVMTAEIKPSAKTPTNPLIPPAKLQKYAQILSLSKFAEIYGVCFLFLYHEVAKEGREGGRGEKKFFSESLERRKDRSMK